MPQIVAVGQLTINDTNDGLSAVLSNEGMSLPADKDGVVTSYAGCSTTMFIYVGGKDDSVNWTVTANPSTGVVGSFGTGAALRTYTVTSLTSNSAYVDFSATQPNVPGAATIVRRFSLSISKAGTDGAPGTPGTPGEPGAPGAEGLSYVKAYCASSTAATTTAPPNTKGRTSLPPDNSGGLIGTYTTSTPILALGQRQYQTDGVYNPITDYITWSVPYWSAFKAGDIESITDKTGTLTVTGTISSANGKFAVDNQGQVTAKAITIAKDDGTVILSSGTALNAAYAPPVTLPFNPMKNWEFRSSLERWTVGGSTVSLGSDSVIVTSTGADPVLYSPTLSFSGRTYDKIRMRVRRLGGSGWQGQIYYANGTHNYEEGYSKIIPVDSTIGGAWTLIEWDMSALTAGGNDWTTSTITNFRIDLGASSSDIFEIDWISLGRYGAGSDELAATAAAAATTAIWSNVTGSGRPADNASSDVTLIGRGATITGNNAVKISGTNAWDCDVYSQDSFTGGAYASVVVADTDSSYYMFGLNSDPKTDTSYSSIDYAILLTNGGGYFVYESGSQIGSAYTSFAVGDIFAVVYDGSSVKYLKNGAVFYISVSAASKVANQVLFFDSSLNTYNSVIKGIRFGPMSSNNWSSIGGSGKPEDNATFTSPSKGNALNDDPAIENINAWIVDPGVSLTTGGSVSGAVGNKFFACDSGTDKKVYAKRTFAIDPNKTYNLSAVLYADSGNNRNMYVFVNFFDYAGTWLATSPSWGGAMSGYTYGSIPPANQWTRQGGNFGANTGLPIPAAARTAQIGVWFQYSGNGNSAVRNAAMDIRCYDNTDAFAALTAINAMADDNVLSKAEKSDAIQNWNATNLERSSLVPQANALGVNANAYGNAQTALGNYLSGLSPSWNDLTKDTPIVGADWRSVWNTYYDEKQKLINAMAASASTTSTWSGVWGAGKPENGATVGAIAGTNLKDASGNVVSNTDFLNSYLSLGGNLCYNGDFANGLDGWTLSSGGSPIDPISYCNSQHVTGAGLDWTINSGVGMGSTTMHVRQNNAIQSPSYAEILSDPIPVVAGKRYCVSAYTGAHRCKVDVFAYIYDATGSSIGYFGADMDYNNADFNGGPYLVNYKRHQQLRTLPANACFVKVCIRKFATFSGAGYTDSWMFVGRVQVEEVALSATAAGPWNPSAPAASNYAAIGSATAAIAAISSDSVLSKGEKLDVVQKWNTCDNEKASLDPYADSLGVSRTSYDAAHSALSSYLSALSPAWSDTTQDTPIDPTVWKAKWNAYYQEKQNLINAMAAKAATVSTWTGVSGPGKPADNASSDVILIGRGITVNGNTIIKTTGTYGWDADCYSQDSYTGGAFASGRITDASRSLMIGLNTDPLTDTNYTSIDYALYTESGRLLVYESGAGVSVGTCAAGDVLSVIYDGSIVRYLQNGVIVKTTAAAANLKLSLDISIYHDGLTLNNVRFGPLSSNNWNSIGSRPSDDQIKNNLIDVSWWKKGGSLPPGWDSNGEAYSFLFTGNDSPVASILGPKGAADIVLYAKEATLQGSETASGGGWNSTSFTLDITKTYRFVVPVRRLSGTGNAYWGTTGVADLNTTNLQGNPYFVSGASLPTDRWYLMIGYIYPANSTGNTHDNAGLWDCKTGKKVSAGLNWCFMPDGRAVNHRAYQYYASTGAEQIFGRPMINLVDGTEPSLREFFEGAQLGVNVDGKVTNTTDISNNLGSYDSSVNVSPGTARTVISDLGIRVYDSSGALRIKIGVL